MRRWHHSSFGWIDATGDATADDEDEGEDARLYWLRVWDEVDPALATALRHRYEEEHRRLQARRDFAIARQAAVESEDA